MITAITYRTRDNRQPTCTIHNPIVDEAEVIRLRNLPETIYNPNEKTLIVTF